MTRPRLAVLTLLCAAPVMAAADPRQVRWDELAATYGGRTVEVRTAAGKIHGNLERADAQGMTVGGKAIARPDFRELRVRRKGRLWRSVFVVWGLLSTAGAALEGGAASVATGLLLTVGGLVLGDYLDRRAFTVVLLD